jgi:uncharacterized protein YgbK (DUF1537 family)
LAAAEAIVVASGSCSPTTEAQIRTALGQGFAGVALDFAALANGDGVDEAMASARAAAQTALRQAQSPLIYTALGPATVVDGGGGNRVGAALGAMLRDLTEEFGLQRVAVAGGDTSSHALSALDVSALTLRRPIPETPGSPVCQAHCDDNSAGFEIALKGGQVGRDDYFVWLRDGES